MNCKAFFLSCFVHSIEKQKAISFECVRVMWKMHVQRTSRLQLKLKNSREMMRKRAKSLKTKVVIFSSAKWIQFSRFLILRLARLLIARRLNSLYSSIIPEPFPLYFAFGLFCNARFSFFSLADWILPVHSQRNDVAFTSSIRHLIRVLSNSNFSRHNFVRRENVALKEKW